MIYKKTDDCVPFLAGDKTFLREVLHPVRDKIDIGYSIAKASLDPGESSLPHQLSGSETYYFLSGEGRLHCGNKKVNISSGTLVLIPPNEKQFLVNSGREPLVFLCIVEPFWREEDEQIL